MANKVDEFTGSIPGFEGYDPNKAEGVFDEKDIASTLNSVGEAAQGKLSSFNLVTGAAQTNFRNSITPSGSINEDGQFEFASANYDAMDDPNVLAAAKDIGLSEAGVKGTAGLVLAPLLLMDAGYRATNTVVGGTVLLGADAVPTNLAATATGVTKGSTINPLYGDGFSLSDIPDTYKLMWGVDQAAIGRDGRPIVDDKGNEVTQVNAITAGQAITIGAGVSWLNALDLFTPGDMRGSLDKTIAEDSIAKLSDPNNTRDLLDWKWGLHTDFNIGNLKERDSALNQGLGRWISGAADSAVLWWAAPEVIGLKVAGVAARSLLVRSIGDLSDLNSLNTSLRLHSDFRRGAQGGQRTAVGQLVESLARMNQSQIARHKIATTSTDAALIARTFGPAKTFEDAALRLRAISGDKAAIAKLMETDVIVADTLSLNMETLTRATRDLGLLNLQRADLLEESVGMGVGMNAADLANTESLIRVIRAEADQADLVVQAAIEEQPALGAALAGISKEAGIPNAVSLRRLEISKLGSGPLSANRMEKQATKAVSKQNGENLWFVKSFKAGGTFGRQIRVWHSAVDYMKTHRMKGLIDLNDSNDVLAEADGVIQTLPMFRRLAKQQVDEAIMPGTQKTVAEFRREFYSKLISATNSTKRNQYWKEFETDVWKAMTAHYGLDEVAAAQLLEKYRGLREAVVERVKEKGIISQDGETHVLKDMQSLLAEKLPTIDFHYIENIFRLETGSGLQRAKGWSDIKGSKASALIDALWRPLVLLRVGYTTRNVLEGNLRELAMYKTLGIASQRNFGTSAIDKSLTYRVGSGFGRGIARIAKLRTGTVRQSKLNLESKQRLAIKAKEQLTEAEKSRDAVERLINQRWAAADQQAKETLTKEFKETVNNRTAVTAEEVNTEVTGEMTALADDAAEITVPGQYVLPLYAGSSGRRHRFAAGFDSPEEAQVRVAMADSTDIGNAVSDPKLQGQLADDNPLAPYSPQGLIGQTEEEITSNIKNWLNSRDAKQWDELILRQQNQGGLDQSQADMYNRLVDRASRRAVYQATKNGDVVVRTIDPNTGTYEIIRDFNDISIEDLNNDLIGILQKEQLKNVQYVRANVFGSHMDLRASQIDLPVGTGGGNSYEELYELTGMGSEVNRIVGDDLAKQFDLEIIENLLDMARNDPELAAALRLKILVNKMPPHMKKYMEESGAVIDTKEIKRLLKLQKKNLSRVDQTKTDNKEKVREFTEAIKLKYWTDENGRTLTPEEFEKLIPSVDEELMNLVFHGGPKVPGDVLDIDPVLTAENLANLKGMGFYTTRDPGIGVSYIFNRRDELTGEEVLYRAILPDGEESRFIDLDAPMEIGNAPGMGTPDEVIENEQFMQELFGEMFEDFAEQNPDLVRGMDINEDFDTLWQSVDDNAAEMVVAQETAPPIGQDPRTHPINLDDYRIAIDNFFLDIYLYSDNPGSFADGFASKMRNFGGNLRRNAIEAEASADQAYASQMLWVSALRNQGALGVKHVGGRANKTRPHDVFIWYEVPEIEPISEVTADMLRLALVKKQADELLKNANDAELTSHINLSNKLNFNNYRPRGLDATNLNAQQKSKMVEYMRAHGVGSLTLDDAYSPSGKTTLTSPDMMAVSTDQAEAAIPSKRIGKDFVDRTLPRLEQEAMVRQPSVLKSSQMQDDELLPFLGNDDELFMVVRGEVKGSPELNAKLATVLESSGYSHIQVGAFGSGSSKFVNTADLVSNKKTGVAYGSMLDESELEQTRSMILSNSDDWDNLNGQFESMSAAVDGKREALDLQISNAQAAAKKLEKRLGRKASGDPVKGGLGSGMEKFVGDFDPFETLGPTNVNNQGSMYEELTSSANTNLANLYGYTDYAMMSLRQSSQLSEIKAGSEFYFTSMAGVLNRYHRNDQISKRIISGQSDDEIITYLMGDEIGKKYVRDVQGFGALKGLVDNTQLTEDARNEMIDLIVQRRFELNELVPDPDVLARLADNELSPNFLQTRMGWRTDLITIKDRTLVDNQRGDIRNFLGKVMHTIGALPEDALVRHPFYRARWREEMQRQADLYASQGVKEFSEAQINAMDRVAKKYGVQQVNQSLYTIQRLSTPAHVFKFIVPFFPAWASAMRFWMVQVPARNPEAIARYAMLYNSPESAGWVYDMDGNKITGTDSFSGRLTNKLFGGGEGNIVVQFNTKSARDRMAKLTGGMSQLKVPTGSMDFMLQGEHPFIPGLHPFGVVPLNYIAARKPDIATAFETGDIQSMPFFENFVGDELNEWLMSVNVTEPLYKAAVPFGRPTQEKGFVDLVTQTFLPGTGNKLWNRFRGMDSVAFSNSAKEIYRTQMTEWDLDTNPNKGPAPEFLEAIEKAETYWWFRAFSSAVMPFSVNAVSPYTFYIEESRRIDREVYDNGGTYNDASLKFLELHGSAFFRYRVSLTGGSSGMGANVGEFKEYERDPNLMATLADIGDADASFITMATRPFQDSSNEDGFDPAVYAWQQKRKIEGTTGKYIRGGEQAESPETRANRELGWIEYNKVAEKLDALAEERDTTIGQDPQLAAVKLAMVAKLGVDYPEWFEAYNDPKTNRWVQSNTALEAMFDSGYFETHKNHPVAGAYANAMLEYRSLRMSVGQVLRQRDLEGGSANIKAKSNADIAAAWEQMMNKLKRSDTTGNFTNAYERFFANDTLAPVPALEAASG